MPTISGVKAENQYSHENLSDPEFTIDVLHNSITEPDETTFQLAMSYLKKTSFDLNKPLDEDTPPILFTAIDFENQYAVEQLLKSGLVDVRTEYDGMNALYRAAWIGNLPILKLIYGRDNTVNSIGDSTPLIKTITILRSYSLIHDSNWKSDENKKKMIDWYEGQASIPDELDISTKYHPSQLPILEIDWKGGLAMAKFLLERGANPKIEDDLGRDAEFIVNNLSSEKCLPAFNDCDQTLKFLSEKNGVLSFYGTLEDRKKTKKIRVKINYDPKEMRELINSYVKKLVDKHAPQKPNFKEWDERFSKLTHDVHTATSHATSATALAIGAHAKVDAQTVVINHNGAVLAHLISRVDKTEADIKTIIEDYSPLKEAANIARELAMIRANKVQHSFYEEVFKKIQDFIASFKLLNTGMVQNQNYTIAGKIGTVVELVGGKIPIVGIAAGLISKGITKAADLYEGRKWARVYHLVPADHLTFSKELAIAITKTYSTELTQIGVANAAKPDEAMRQALKLATKAAGIITDSMSDTKVDKNKGVPQGVIGDQLSKLQHDKTFKAKVEKYAPSTSVATAMVTKEVYSSKGHSPVKVTVMVPNSNLINQPLGSAASTKPTPPPVPARPPVSVAFSGSNPATSNKPIQATAIGQMAVGVAATATRKMVPTS